MRLPNVPRNALLPAIVTVVVVAGASFASTHHSGVVEAVRAARDAAHAQHGGTHIDGDSGGGGHASTGPGQSSDPGSNPSLSYAKRK